MLRPIIIVQPLDKTMKVRYYIRILAPTLTAQQLDIIEKLISFMKWAPVQHEIFQVL